MKKVLWFALVLALLALVALPAGAEAPNQPIRVDWTQVVVWLIGALGTALSALLARAWMGYVRPWLEQRGLTDAAVIVVNAVEAIMGGYGGEDKWRLALDKMKERGFDVDTEDVIDALKAAWKQMDISQMAAGVKEEVPGGEGGKGVVPMV